MKCIKFPFPLERTRKKMYSSHVCYLTCASLSKVICSVIEYLARYLGGQMEILIVRIECYFEERVDELM